MPDGFDVFLCHHSDDKPTVKKIAQQLRDEGLRPWLDEWELAPGRSWQEGLEEQIGQIRTAAVFVGTRGLGPWQSREIRAFLGQFVKRGCPLIPVLLPDCAEPAPELPVFLRDLTWVDYRKTDPDPLGQLIWGITGKKPDRPSPQYPNPETRDLSLALRAAYRHRAELEARGEDTAALTESVLDLRRKIREGGQLKAGDSLDGRFELLEPIGCGGFAQVWRAYDERRHIEVAVKVLHGQYAEDRSWRERFFRGARQMARLQHPKIVQVIEESCEEGGYHFFVMEYLGGGNFREAVKEDLLSLEERLRIVLEVGEALAFAHERDVIHRDVKPDNILLDTENRPKLTDFDLVRAADTTGGTRTMGLGTFFYAAPEAMIDAKAAAEPADVYALGMTLVFALYGTDLPPQIVRNPVDFITSLEVHASFRRVLQRAVAWEVEQRWASVAELCQALQSAVSEENQSAAHWQSRDRMVVATTPPADLEFRVYIEGETRLVYVLRYAEGKGTRFDHRIEGPTLQVRPREYQLKVLKCLELLGKQLGFKDQKLTLAEVEQELAALGHDLYDELFPRDLRAEYSHFRERIRSLLVVSQEPWIPWELVKPYSVEGDDLYDDDFLCCQFEMTRWLAKGGALLPVIEATRVAAVEAAAPESVRRLRHARDEVQFLQEIAERHEGVTFQALPDATYPDVMELLEKGDNGVLLFVGHGEFDADNPNESCFLLGDGRALRPLDFHGFIERRLQQDRPLVFFNSCQVAQQDFSLTRIGGWAVRWVCDCGCGAFVGPQWSVDDALACLFSQTFFASLDAGETFGQAARTARLRVRELTPGPSWLAYTVYAHPNGRLHLGRLPRKPSNLPGSERSR